MRFNRDEAGRSVFLLAYLSGHPEIAALFTELGLDLDLVEASIVGDWDRAKELGERTPGLVNADHPVGGTAMYAAALFGHGVSMFRLNFVGGDPQRGGVSVLHGAVLTGNAYLVEYVIRKGGDVSLRDSRGRTPFDLAVVRGNDPLAEILRNHETIARDMARNDPACSRMAYDASGEPYAQRKLDRPATVLSGLVGVSHGNFEAVRERVERDPDLVHATATTEEMAVEASAHIAPMTESVSFFLDHGAPLSLPTCLRMGRIDRARELLQDDPARIRERGPHDFALTYYPSIGGGDVEAAQLLVDFDLDVNMEGQLGQTGLHWAARAGQDELVEFWLDHGADVNARVRDSHPRSAGATPLDFALRAERSVTSDLLSARGGRPG
jgi:ankyrin repeat protein